jgi:hypothetical protein
LTAAERRAALLAGAVSQPKSHESWTHKLAHSLDKLRDQIIGHKHRA